MNIDVSSEDWDNLAGDVRALRRAIVGAKEEGTLGLLTRVHKLEKLVRWLILAVVLSLADQIPAVAHVIASIPR